MQFKCIAPPHTITSFIECYWTIDDEDTTQIRQKIIPDGFPEIIFHYGDPFKILISETWELQPDFLLAGQITKFFFLENSGVTGVLGIKFKPTALSRIFNLNMKEYNDRVLSLENFSHPQLREIKHILSSTDILENKINRLNSFFETLILARKLTPAAIDHAIDLINKKKGMISIVDLSKVACLGERQFLNQFRQQVGLSPKLYARIVRLNYIFKLVNEKKENWTALAYEAAYFDQSHFIKDFKLFTGENPSNYSFDEKNFANFFLKR